MHQTPLFDKIYMHGCQKLALITPRTITQYYIMNTCTGVFQGPLYFPIGYIVPFPSWQNINISPFIGKTFPSIVENS